MRRRVFRSGDEKRDNRGKGDWKEEVLMKQAGLEALFDFQRFWKNARLEELAEETMKRYCLELSDEELAYVSAAGEPEVTDPAPNMFRGEDGGDG